jgi:hypothetical protein
MYDYMEFLNRLSLVGALWWFIENGDSLETADRAEVFFYLRDRVRAGA